MTANKPVTAPSFGDDRQGEVPGSDLAKVDAHVITREEYEEIPELTEDVEEADLFVGDTLIRRGRPPKADRKQLVSLRLSPEVLEHFRAAGPGWQTRIDNILRAVVSTERDKAERSS
jgi:uncharacterized protein (DUF4415 family)